MSRKKREGEFEVVVDTLEMKKGREILKELEVESRLKG